MAEVPATASLSPPPAPSAQAQPPQYRHTASTRVTLFLTAEPGLPPAEVDPERKSKDSGGAGLGLAIAKSLVRAHGGEISARSVSGEGTTIRFTLPLRPSR